MHGNGIPRPALGTINVILARPGGDIRTSFGVMSVVGGSDLGSDLKANIDVFAWNAYDVPGINLELACHQLNVNLEVVSRKQPPR